MTGIYSVGFYRSSVDGLAIRTANDYRNVVTTSSRYPLMTSTVHPAYSSLFQSSRFTHTPNPRIANTTFLKSTNIRWDSAINIVDREIRSLSNQKIFSFEPKFSYQNVKPIYENKSKIGDISPR
jgi:hypothetical protein